ncbi:hypothetical protein [Pantoea dispersa]|uniref:hypothetical protein n=1 Tax=Pantoea dispersa TaxID=59814 RepID=UPI0024AFB442|nr:hypothetical protein [Pantoea dispersa]MDI6636485.1 hypothetical protein [Pantoea dispersa]
MLSEDRLSHIAGHPDSHDAEAVAMAQEILQLRRTLGAPWAVVQPLGALYVEDGNAAMIWPTSLAEHGDVCLYRLEKPSPVAEAAPPAAKQRGRRKKMPAQE